MKKIFFILHLLLTASLLWAQTEPMAEIQFEKSSFDFGDIKQGQVVMATFRYKNIGKAPLILSNVATTCGCTVPSWPKDPLAPGKTAEITATFNSAGKMGQQNKVITVFSNAKTSQAQVSIICNILPQDLPTNMPGSEAAPK